MYIHVYALEEIPVHMIYVHKHTHTYMCICTLTYTVFQCAFQPGLVCLTPDALIVFELSNEVKPQIKSKYQAHMRILIKPKNMMPYVMRGHTKRVKPTRTNSFKYANEHQISRSKLNLRGKTLAIKNAQVRIGLACR